MKNRREYKRTRTSIEVSFWFLRQNLTKPLFEFRKKGVVRDIGGGGLYIESRHLTDKILRRIEGRETFIKVEFSLPGEDLPVSAICKVRNVRPQHDDIMSGVGIEYILIDSNKRYDIIKFTEMQRRIVVGSDDSEEE